MRGAKLFLGLILGFFALIVTFNGACELMRRRDDLFVAARVPGDRWNGIMPQVTGGAVVRQRAEMREK